MENDSSYQEAEVHRPEATKVSIPQHSWRTTGGNTTVGQADLQSVLENIFGGQIEEGSYPILRAICSAFVGRPLRFGVLASLCGCSHSRHVPVLL